MRPDPVLQLLGLAQKSGSVKSGEFMAESTIKSGRSFLCIIAGDASDNTRKHFHDMCTYHNVPVIEYSDRESLGHAIGKEYRATLCITNEQFARQIQKKIPETPDVSDGGSD